MAISYKYTIILLLSTPNSFLPDFAWKPMDAAPSYLRVFCGCCCYFCKPLSSISVAHWKLSPSCWLALCRSHSGSESLSAVAEGGNVKTALQTTSSPPSSSCTRPSHSSEMFPEPSPVCESLCIHCCPRSRAALTCVYKHKHLEDRLTICPLGRTE